MNTSMTTSMNNAAADCQLPNLNQCRLALYMPNNLSGGKWGKMGLGLLRYSEATISCVIDPQCAGRNVRDVTSILRDVPVVAIVEEAVTLGADTFVIGVAPAGGGLEPDWWRDIKTGVGAGLSLVNGLHQRMETDSELQTLLRPGRWIWDVRTEPDNLPNGSGAARTLSCRRVLTVGTDMKIGKMTASIEMDRAARRQGIRSKFLATGQIGICITGDRTPLASGVALDAVRVDFASGAVEAIVMNNGHDCDLLHVEGQGSLLHPASTAWLPLIRGACPTHLILVHRAGQEGLQRHPEILIPPLPVVVNLYEAVCAGGGTQPPARVVGIALNCGHLDDGAAKRAMEQTQQETGLPVVDVVREGGDALLAAVMSA